MIGIPALLAIALQLPPKADPQTGKLNPSRAARAEELLEQARAASGADEALRGATSLSVSIHLRRFMRYIAVVSPQATKQKEKTLTGSISIEFQFPDKFRKRVSTSTLSGYKYSYVEVVNGSRAWRDPPLVATSSNRDPKVIDVSDFERSLAYQQQSARQQFSFYALAWLLRVLPKDALRFEMDSRAPNASGEADSPRAYGLNDPPTWLLLDRESHLPMGFDTSFNAILSLPVIVEGVTFRRSDFFFMLERAREERRAQVKPPRQITLQTRLSDHRRVAGTLVPHRLVTIVDGRQLEELVITKFEVNPHLNPKHFEPKSQSQPRAK